MSRTPVSLALLLGLVIATPARAERLVSFREALTAAQEANPSLGRADLDVDAAEASLRSAKGFLDPTLGANVTWLRRNQEGYFQGFPYKAVTQNWDFGLGINGTAPTGTQWNFDTSLDYNFSEYETQFNPDAPPTSSVEDVYTANLSVGLRQPLLRGITLAWNMQSVTRARSSLALADLSYERTRQDTLAQAAQGYWTWAYQVELVEIARRQVEVAEEALRVGRLRLESGEIAPVERTRLEAAQVQAQQDLLTAEIAAAQAGDSLLLLMGETPGQEVVPSTPIGEVPPLELDVDAAVEVALSQNLELALQRSRVDAAGTDLAVAKHGQLPLLSAVASAGVGNQNDTLGGTYGGLFGANAFPFYSIGGELSVPLGNRAARGEAQRTEATLHQAEIQLAELERSVRGQVEHQVRQLQQARRRMELADVNLRLAEETLAAEEALERAGRSIQKNVLEARTEKFRAEVEAAKARADYRLAQTELLRLQGQIDLALP